MNGKLYLIPTDLGDCKPNKLFPQENIEIMSRIGHFVVEDIRTARRFLRSAGYKGSFDEHQFIELNEHSRLLVEKNWLDPCLNGHDMALMSDAGIPAVADPGHELVLLAHHMGIQVIPLPGPSSLFMALMASGLNGQQFTFHGYLPVKEPGRSAAIKRIEQEANKSGYTQIFIETPYRSHAMFQCLMEQCAISTVLSIAANISLQDEYIKTKTIAGWRKNPAILQKKMCVFSLARGA